MQSSDLYNPSYPENNHSLRYFGPNYLHHDRRYLQQFEPSTGEREKNSKLPIRSMQWRSNVPYRYSDGQGEKEDPKDALDWEKYDNASAAFLGPQLWDKTIPVNPDLKFEYMDIDEFLNENNLEDEFFRKNITTSGGTYSLNSSPATHEVDKLSPSISPTQEVHFENTLHTVTNPVHDVDRVTSPETDSSQSPGSIKQESSPESPSDPGSPLTVKTEDLESVNGQHLDFDPTTRCFSEDELKPQPMIKKSRKQYVPNDLKDERYWARRRKNNLAAKRSRDARRVKENQIALRAGYLEKENNALRDELEKTRDIVETLKKRLGAYESRNSRNNE